MQLDIYRRTYIRTVYPSPPHIEAISEKKTQQNY